ncbi:hypothetical protein GQ53DRAFT_433455 [Thozetella sp. PMI_491]|nr:hypothetical protein GQ53DRAFT_433455 [Thozetella sp. PMI_491]
MRGPLWCACVRAYLLFADSPLAGSGRKMLDSYWTAWACLAAAVPRRTWEPWARPVDGQIVKQKLQRWQSHRVARSVGFYGGCRRRRPLGAICRRFAVLSTHTKTLSGGLTRRGSDGTWLRQGR